MGDVLHVVSLDYISKNNNAGPCYGHLGYVAEEVRRKGNWMVRWGEWRRSISFG